MISYENSCGAWELSEYSDIGMLGLTELGVLVNWV